MAGQVITVAQQKGGAGKTTLTAHLAVAWMKSGKSIALVDIDPQESLSDWHRQRVELLGEGSGITLRQVSGWRASTEVGRLKRDHDLVVMDSPPHGETAAKIAIRSADMIVVPVQLSPMDLWATRTTLDLAESEKTPSVLVLNRVPPRGRLPDEIRTIIKQLKLPVAKTTLGNRTAFAASMMEGKGVTEFAKTSPAAEEIDALAGELMRRMKRL